MKCLKCRGEMREGFTVYAVDLGKCCVVVRRVPCLKCEECGETVFTGVVMAKLEALVEATQNAMTEVAIVSFPQDVA